jgi:hypothetical protein
MTTSQELLNQLLKEYKINELSNGERSKGKAYFSTNPQDFITSYLTPTNKPKDNGICVVELKNGIFGVYFITVAAK